MHRYQLKLIRNGNSTQVTMPKQLLEHLRWRPGDTVILELTRNDTIEIYPRNLLQRVGAGSDPAAGTPRPAVQP